LLSTILLFYYGISSAYDKMSFNRARWDAIHYLQNDLKIPNNKIDGHFEFNAWYFFDKNYKRRSDRNWWWVQDEDYIVTYGTTKGFTVLKEYNYSKLLPPFYGKYYILKKDKY